MSYALPRPVTVRSDAREQQRTRIATINARADFVHVAVPQLTESVYVRGDLANASAYQLLPGPVSIFMPEVAQASVEGRILQASVLVEHLSRVGHRHLLRHDPAVQVAAALGIAPPCSGIW